MVRTTSAVRRRPTPERVQKLLLAWYDEHRRSLPWRGARDPYAIWLSEVMLQQTQVKTVLGRYPSFIERFPTVRALARASIAEVLHAWQGLGYYSRARRLHETARAIDARHGGEFPRSRDALLELPGIGAYSAGAVASIAFGERVPVVDGNVVRVLTRLFSLEGDPGRAPLRSLLWNEAALLVPEGRPGDFNQALMELGATVCTPKNAACERCPLARECLGRARGTARRLPELPQRRSPERVRVAAVIVRRGGRVLVVRLPDDEPRWAGLHVFPFVPLEANETFRAGATRAAERYGVRASIGARLFFSEYTITRFRMKLEAFEATTGRAARGSFYPLERLEELAMPAPHRKLARLLAAARAGAA